MSSDIDPALPVQGFSARWTAPVRPTTRRIAQGSTYTRRNVPPFDRIAVTAWGTRRRMTFDDATTPESRSGDYVRMGNGQIRRAQKPDGLNKKQRRRARRAMRAKMVFPSDAGKTGQQIGVIA